MGNLLGKYTLASDAAVVAVIIIDENNVIDSDRSAVFASVDAAEEYMSEFIRAYYTTGEDPDVIEDAVCTALDNGYWEFYDGTVITINDFPILKK